MDKAGVRCPRASQMNSLEADQWLQLNEPVIGNMIPLDLDLNHAGKEIVPQSQADPGGEGRSRLTGILPVVDVAATGLLDLRQCFPVPLLAVQLPLEPPARHRDDDDKHHQGLEAELIPAAMGCCCHHSAKLLQAPKCSVTPPPLCTPSEASLACSDRAHTRNPPASRPG